MTPPIKTEELNAVREAKQLIHDSPREAPRLIEALVQRYKAEGKTTCALEARRYQCFAYIGNLEYDEAKDHIDILIGEATNADEKRFLGVAEMYFGIISLECGESDTAVEFFDQAIEIGIETQDLDLIYRVQMNLGYALLMLERYEDALESFKQSIRHFDVDDASVTNGPIYYNIAYSTMCVAHQAAINGDLTMELADQAYKSLETARQAIGQDSNLVTLTKILFAMYQGITAGPHAGLRALAEVEKLALENSIATTSISYLTAQCRLLELAEDWAELSRSSQKLLDTMRKARNASSIQIILRLAAKAYANLGEFERAYELLSESFSRLSEVRNARSDRRAQMINLRLDLERQKFDQDVLRMRNKTLIERNKILEQESRFDPLSRILNRRGTEEALQQYTDRKFADRFAIALLDIDHFKKINDDFGHAIGDRVIQEFAACLANSRTNPSKLGRWGGEEFLIVFDVADEQEMAMLGQTLVEEIRSLKWDHIQPGIQVTASCGLSMWKRGDSLDHAIRIADDMMYSVKHHGRNNWQAAA